MSSRPFEKVHTEFIERGKTLLMNEGVAAYNKKHNFKIQHGEEPLSALSVLLKVGGEIKGSISLQDMDKEHAFSQSDVQLLETLAKSTSIALENARLFDESLQRQAELEVVNTAQDALASKLDISAIYREVGEKVREIFRAQTISIHSYDFEKGLVTEEYGYEKGMETMVPERPMTPAHRDLASRGTTLINEGMTDYIKKHDHKIVAGEMPKSLLSVRLKVDNDIKGAISLQDVDKEHAFTQSDVQLLETLAKSTSIALENARLFNESLQRQAELEIVNTAQDALAAKLDKQSIFEEVGEKIREIFKAQTVVLYTYDLEKNLTIYEYTFEDGERLPSNIQPINDAHREFIESGQTLLMNEGMEEYLASTNTKITTGKPPKAILSVLLKVAGEVRGAISLQDVEREHVFTQSDVQLLETLAKSTSIALENARLFEEIQSSNQEISAALERQNATGNILEVIARSPGDLSSILEVIASTAARLLDTQNVVIGTVQGEDLNVAAKHGSLPFLKTGEVIPLEEKTVAGQAIREKKTLQALHNQKGKKSKYPKGNETAKKYGYELTLSTPLIREGKAIGVISVLRTKAKFFSEPQVDLLKSFANQAVIAIDNERLFNESNRLLSKTEKLLKEAEASNLEISESLQLQTANSDILNEIANSPTEIQPVLDAVAENAAELCAADDSQIYTIDGKELRQVAHFGTIRSLNTNETLPLRKGLVTGRAVLECRTLHIEDYNKLSKKKYPLSVELQKRLGHRTTLVAPLLLEGKAIGAVVVRRKVQRAFSDKQIAILENFANQAVIAIEKARLFTESNRLLEETTKRNAELAVINSLQDALAKELDIKGIYNAVGDQIKDIFDAQAVMIGSFDHKSKLVSLPYMFEKGEKFDLPPQAFSAMNRKMIRDKKTIVINENADAESKKLGMEVPAGEASKSGVWIPIIVGKDVTGFVSLQNIDRENAFPESDVQLLTTVTNSLAVALENARLFDEIVQRNAELDIINSVGEAMAQQLDVATVTKIVGDKVKDIVSAEAVFIGLFEEGEESVTFPYLFDEGKYFEVGKQPRGGLSNLVKESRKPQVFNTVEEQEKAGGILLDIEEGNDQQTQSWMGVPIITADKVIGLVSVQSYQIAAFSESDVQLLSTLATNMGVAIRNAQLYQEVERRVSEMAILAEVGEEISQELELNALLEQIASQAMDLLSGRNAIIRLRQPDDTLPAVVAVGAFQDLFKGNVIKVGEGITGKIIQSGQAELVNNPLDDPRLMHVPGTEEEDEAILFAPLNAGDRALGVLVVWREKSKHGEFNDIDLNFGVGLARQAAIAIQNAQLFEEATQRAEEMAALAAVGEEISQELEVQTLLEQIASRAINLLDATDAVIRLVLPDGTMPAIVDVGERARKMTEETVSQRVGEGINGLIALSGVAEIVNSVKSDKRAVPVAGLSLDELGYAMFVPFISKGKTIAVMSIFRSGPDKKPFDQDDLTFVISLARQAAIAMGNANLFEEVQSQKEYFEALLVNNPAAVLTIDIEEFTVTSWNPAAEAMFGYSAEEAIGKKVDSLVANDPDLHQEAEGYSAKALALGHVKIKAKRTRKDGTLIDVEVQGLPVTVEGQQKGFIVIYHDISELESARRAAEEANQAKSAFLANMSHELRTPLNAIIGFTRIVKRKGADILPAKQSDNLDKVLVSADHLLGLINTILDIAKIEAGRMDVRMDNFNIKALVDLCLTTTQPLINAPSVTLLSEIPPNTTELYSDQEKIKQILLNLLSNAAKFTKKGEIKLSVKESNEQIYMTVTDTGIGISQDGVKNIFEEFQQVDDSSTREYGGTGLGLSISRSLAQLLGGDISVFSQEGIGSEFTLSLPLHFKPSTIAEPSIKVQQLEEKTAELTTDKPIVLAIDDNPDVVAILRENLEDQGYQVVGASSGEQGVQKALALQPDAITLDIMMPSKDGWQVLYELKHDVKTKHIPVIILSIVDKKALGFRLGASDYLVKPLNEKAVINSLSNLVASKGVSEKKRILVIDDDHTVIDMVRQLLEDEQHLIEDAADGEIALAKLRDFSPDLILLDLLMPNMDGFEFLEKFRQTKKNKEIPVIILTAKSLSTREIKVLENQVSEVIEKQGLEGKKLISEISKSTQRKPMKAAK
jgi:PAS domain S-box-containing protein